MTLEKFLFEVFRTCLWEEEGSTEHISEHVTHEDVINVAKQLGLDEIAKKFKHISKRSENGDDCNNAWDKLERIANKDYFDAIDKIYAKVIEQPKEKFFNEYDEECGFCKKLNVNKKVGKVFVTNVVVCADEDSNRFKKDENLMAFRYKECSRDEEEDEQWFTDRYSEEIIKIAELI